MRPIQYTAHNTITLLHYGAEFFPALIDAIDSAQAEIYLETYIFAADETGDKVKDALKRAGTRGVMVNVMTDWLGTGRIQAKALQQEFSQANVNFRAFNPWFRHGIARTHRKLAVIDRELGFLGGLNINDDMRADDDFNVILPAPRWDIAVQAVGPLVQDIHREAEAQWIRMGPMKLRLRWQMFRKLRRAKARSSAAGPSLAGLVVRDNLRNRRTIQRAYLQALGHARKSAFLANPYFAPGKKLRRALESAAERGVEVTLLLGVGQFRLQDAIAHSFYPKLLEHGVKIVEYGKTQLHGKVAVIDDVWATVGSSNYDGFSLFVNQEANIVVKDAEFAKSLRSHIELGIADGIQVRLEDYSNIGWLRRLWYGSAFWLYRSMIRIMSGNNYT
ncbi:cardiolipin synthase ClsB [soil metagenome]